MSWKARLHAAVNGALASRGLILASKAEWQRLQTRAYRLETLCRRLNASEQECFDLAVPSRTDARERDAALDELRQSYRRYESPMLDRAQWSEEFVAAEIDLDRFRGDYAYVWQLRDLNTEVHFLAALQYVRTHDRLGLCDRLAEDGAFGAYTVAFEGKLYSRDLLDSILECNFLDERLSLSGREFCMLDIGAGYGRLAHRIAEGFPMAKRIWCADAVADSTYLCGRYLRFRGVNDRAIAVPLPDLEDRLAEAPPDFAVNIHSFSECTLRAIQGWLDLVARFEIPHLLIIPNAMDNEGTELLTTEAGGARLPFLPAVEAAGYRLRERAPKYAEPLMQRHGITPTHYWLFDRER